MRDIDLKSLLRRLLTPFFLAFWLLGSIGSYVLGSEFHTIQQLTSTSRQHSANHNDPLRVSANLGAPAISQRGAQTNPTQLYWPGLSTTQPQQAGTVLLGLTVKSDHVKNDHKSGRAHGKDHGAKDHGAKDHGAKDHGKAHGKDKPAKEDH